MLIKLLFFFTILVTSNFKRIKKRSKSKSEVIEEDINLQINSSNNNKKFLDKIKKYFINNRCIKNLKNKTI